MQWLFWQMGGLGPMAGQNHHFSQYAPERLDYAIDRYVKETNRLYGVLNKRLADREFVAGEYSIADNGGLTVDRSLRTAGPEIGGFPESEAMVRDDQGAAGYGAGVRYGQGDQHAANGKRRGVKKAPFWTDRRDRRRAGDGDSLLNE
jgi:hypothetical protein